MSKVVSSLNEIIDLLKIEDGMTISFHHHLRNGDYVLNMVLEALAQKGLKNLNVNASSVFDTHQPLIGHIQNGVVTGLEANYIGGVVGRAISEGVLAKPVSIRRKLQKHLLYSCAYGLLLYIRHRFKGWLGAATGQ